MEMEINDLPYINRLYILSYSTSVCDSVSDWVGAYNTRKSVCVYACVGGWQLGSMNMGESSYHSLTVWKHSFDSR